jgi:GntR family transcriptional regulator, transcriptional repressor for pyruvate dehydrogenase complex
LKLSPIRKTRVYKIIIEQIKESIRIGTLKPGDKLPSEREFAQRLEVSRTAVREAFSVLDSLNLIDILPGIGIFLKKDLTEEIIEKITNTLMEKETNHINIIKLIEVRQGIEVQAAFLAAQRRHRGDLKALKQAYEKLDAAANRQLVGAQEDLDFHLAIVNASHNDMLAQIFKICYEKFYEGIEQFRKEEMKIPPEEKISLDIEHFNIYEAIVEKDSLAARELVWNHLENVKTSYMTQIMPSKKDT